MAAVPSRGRANEVERSGGVAEAEATRALYERYAGQLYGFCLHRLGSREEAEDAVQTTFLNAFRGLRRGVVPEAEGAWLFKIAENVCLTRHRTAWRRGRVESPSDMQAFQDVTPAREREGGDELIPLGDALSAMPEAQRRAILLREWQGLSYKEIADEMDTSQSAVETLIFRARRSLANALETPWQNRRAAGGSAGRQAFDLGSLLAGLKTLFAGGTAAKVAAVAVVATGTAALAVAESRHPSAGEAAPQKAVASRAPAPRSVRPVPVRSVRPARFERVAATSARPFPTAPTQPVSSKSSARVAASAPGTKDAPATHPSSRPRASAPGAPPAPTAPPAGTGESADARADAPVQADRPHGKARPKPQARPRPRTAPKAKPAPAPAPRPKAAQPKPAPPAPPPPPPAPPPPEEKAKDKEKDKSE